MTLKSIELTNFLSHQKSSLNFDGSLEERDNILIDGVSGSGKSSIVEALVWCLYGIARSDNKSLIRRGASLAKVVLVLKDEKNSILYKIERSINDKNKHELSLSEAPIDGKFFV